MPKRLALIGLVLLAMVASLLSWQALTRANSVPKPFGTPAALATTAGSTPAVTPSARPTSVVASTSPAGTMVVLGDGYSASSSWPQEASKALGLTLVNMSASGTGYHVAPKTCSVTPCTSFKDAAGKVASAEPTVVVVVGGEVDGAYDLRSDAEATLEALRGAVPQATIVYMSPLSARPTYPAWLTKHAETLKAVADQGDALWIDTTSVTATPNAYRRGDLTAESSQQLAALLVEGLE